jgi:hypothetical protein
VSIQPSSSFLERRHASTQDPVFVTIPARRFLAIDGMGPPGADDFRLAASTLKETADRLCATLRRDRIPGPAKPALTECCWWPSGPVALADLPGAFADRSTWHWRQLTELPAAAGEDMVLAAIDETRRRAGRERALLRPVSFIEGTVAQLLHVGGYDGEPAVVAKLLQVVEDEGCALAGPLHILQLADPERVPAGRRRSIVRQPIA